MKGKALYTEVYQKILDGIQKGEFPKGLPLPAERFLCEKYHVSRSTLRTALTMLNEAEVVYTVPRSGTFIQPNFFQQPLTHFYSFTDTLKRNNILIHNDIISYNLITTDSQLMRKTGYPTDSTFHKLIRLRSASDYPLMIETSYLPQSRFFTLNLEDLSSGSLYSFLKTKYDFSPSNATETLRAVMPVPHEKELLQISGTVPCILLERFTYENEILCEYTKSIIRGDKYVFHVDLN